MNPSTQPFYDIVRSWPMCAHPPGHRLIMSKASVGKQTAAGKGDLRLNTPSVQSQFILGRGQRSEPVSEKGVTITKPDATPSGTRHERLRGVLRTVRPGKDQEGFGIHPGVK